MAMAASGQPIQRSSLWDTVLELTKKAQEKDSDPLIGAIQLTSTRNSAGVILPSIDLAHSSSPTSVVPITWKFLEKALTVKIVPPFLLLALLSTRGMPSQLHPAAYRLYMELLSRHAFSSASLVRGPNYQKDYVM